MSIDWTELNAKLPTSKDSDSKEKRKELFRAMDAGNGILSLAEVDKGLKCTLHSTPRLIGDRDGTRGPFHSPEVVPARCRRH